MLHHWNINESPQQGRVCVGTLCQLVGRLTKVGGSTTELYKMHNNEDNEKLTLELIRI